MGCKLGQSDPIVMKLKLDMSCHPLNAYTKFQIDISKHVEKSPENSDGRTDGQAATSIDLMVILDIYIGYKVFGSAI